jgi:hypothetical protein
VQPCCCAPSYWPVHAGQADCAGTLLTSMLHNIYSVAYLLVRSTASQVHIMSGVLWHSMQPCPTSVAGVCWPCISFVLVCALC